MSCPLLSPSPALQRLERLRRQHAEEESRLAASLVALVGTLAEQKGAIEQRLTALESKITTAHELALFAGAQAEAALSGKPPAQAAIPGGGAGAAEGATATQVGAAKVGWGEELGETSTKGEGCGE